MARACQRCANGKRKCSGTFPCDRCVRLGMADSCVEVQLKRKAQPQGGAGGAGDDGSGLLSHPPIIMSAEGVPMIPGPDGGLIPAPPHVLQQAAAAAAAAAAGGGGGGSAKRSTGKRRADRASRDALLGAGGYFSPTAGPLAPGGMLLNPDGSLALLPLDPGAAAAAAQISSEFPSTSAASMGQGTFDATQLAAAAAAAAAAALSGGAPGSSAAGGVNPMGWGQSPQQQPQQQGYGAQLMMMVGSPYGANSSSNSSSSASSAAQLMSVLGYHHQQPQPQHQGGGGYGMGAMHHQYPPLHQPSLSGAAGDVSSNAAGHGAGVSQSSSVSPLTTSDHQLATAMMSQAHISPMTSSASAAVSGSGGMSSGLGPYRSLSASSVFGLPLPYAAADLASQAAAAASAQSSALAASSDNADDDGSGGGAGRGASGGRGSKARRLNAAGTHANEGSAAAAASAASSGGAATTANASRSSSGGSSGGDGANPLAGVDLLLKASATGGGSGESNNSSGGAISSALLPPAAAIPRVPPSLGITADSPSFEPLGSLPAWRVTFGDVALPPAALSSSSSSSAASAISSFGPGGVVWSHSQGICGKPHCPGGPEHVVANAAGAALFNVAPEDIPYVSPTAVTWLHPSDVSARSSATTLIRARRGTYFEWSGRYIRAKVSRSPAAGASGGAALTRSYEVFRATERILLSYYPVSGGVRHMLSVFTLTSPTGVTLSQAELNALQAAADAQAAQAQQQHAQAAGASQPGRTQPYTISMPSLSSSSVISATASLPLPLAPPVHPKLVPGQQVPAMPPMPVTSYSPPFSSALAPPGRKSFTSSSSSSSSASNSLRAGPAVLSPPPAFIPVGPPPPAAAGILSAGAGGAYGSAIGSGGIIMRGSFSSSSDVGHVIGSNSSSSGGGTASAGGNSSGLPIRPRNISFRFSVGSGDFSSSSFSLPFGGGGGGGGAGGNSSSSSGSAAGGSGDGNAVAAAADAAVAALEAGQNTTATTAAENANDAAMAGR